MPSPDQPLEGGCNCGAVRFRVTRPFSTAGYCHCHRCQRRSGTSWTLNASVPDEGFEILAGAESIRAWRPQGGKPKAYCSLCGGHLFSGDPGAGKPIGVRLGTVDSDPGIRPEWRQWVSSSPAWDPIPDDGLPRYPESRPA